MATYPLLLDLGAKKPTTREIASLVKQGGITALTEAERRADEARYQEVTCRSALNRVQGMPFNWTLNPYRGCTHGCHYCFARRYHVQFEMDSDDEFASVILVKRNFVEVLQRELDRPSWSREQVAFGTATDPYQPIEGHYRLTRQSVIALARGRTPIGLIVAESACVSGARGWNCATLSVPVTFGLQCPAVRKTISLFRIAVNPRVQATRDVPETR